MTEEALCACGCGKPLKGARKTHYGVKGQPYKFVSGHNKHAKEMVEVPYGYCHCGCGRKTTICDKTNLRTRGLPARFLNGHNNIQPAKAWRKKELIEKFMAYLPSEEELDGDDSEW